MVIVLFMNGILVPLNSLEAPMVDEILHGGAEMLSLLSAALTVHSRIHKIQSKNPHPILQAAVFKLSNV
jgi:hypothetical protein